MANQIARLHVPMLAPTDVINHLAKGARHWREGYSAHALATTWFTHNGLPSAVRNVLETHERFRGAELIDAIFERQTDLGDGLRGPSQTDLLAILGVGSSLAIAAVEGKVDEPFGERVSEWLTEGTRRTRLNRLTEKLGLGSRDVSMLRYQLLHRTMSAVYEAERYRAPTAVMIVHSFSAKSSGWVDFEAFVGALGLTANRDELVGPKRAGTVELFLGWASDRLPAVD